MIENIENRSIIINVTNENIKLPKNIKEDIDKFWERIEKEDNNLFNGEIMTVCSFENIEDNIIINCKKTNYAHYLYDERIGLPNEYSCHSLAAGCLLETSDNYYIIGELATGMSIQHCLQISGGAADNRDIKNGNINILDIIEREVKEELNIDLKDNKNLDGYKIKYMSFPNEKANTYIFFGKGKLKKNKEEIKRNYEKYLQKLINNNGEIEFQKLHFINKENAIQQLQNLKRPKREYLTELLKVDSNNIE